jgi:hypothetical protein
MGDFDDLENWIDAVRPAGARNLLVRGQTKDRCKRGHLLTPENTYVSDNGMGGKRNCKKCLKLRAITAKERAGA